MSFKLNFFLGLIREHASLSTYGDTDSVRKIVADDIKKVIEANPVFHEKLKCPVFKSQRLRYLLNQRFLSLFPI